MPTEKKKVVRRRARPRSSGKTERARVAPSDLRARKLRVRRARYRLQLWVLVLVLTLLFAGIVWLSNSRYLSVSEVEVAGSNDESLLTLAESKTEEYLASRRWWLFPYGNILFLNTNKVEEVVGSAHPDIARVTAALDNKTLLVTLVERVPTALYCLDSALEPESATPLQGEGQEEAAEAMESEFTCVMLDWNGVAYKQAEKSLDQTGSELIVIHGLNPLPDLPGALMPELSFKRLLAVREVLLGAGYLIDSIDISPPADVFYALSTGSEVRITTALSARDPLSDIKLLLDDETLPPLSSLEYLDLRFGNRAVYKERTEEETEEKSTDLSTAEETSDSLSQ